MFGYIQPLKCELKIKEYDLFRAYYCGLCKSMKRYGKQSQLLINYDCTFLALLLDSLKEDMPRIKKERCAYNPLAKKSVVWANASIEYAADINMLLAYYKFKDDYQDHEARAMLMPLFLMAGKKAEKKLPQQARIIKECLGELKTLENENCRQMDAAAHTNARMLEGIFSLAASNNSNLGSLGYNLGRWIYLMDALDDTDKDTKHKNYNVLIENGKLRVNEEEMRFALESSLAHAAKSYEKLMLKHNKNMLDNIIYAGVRHRTQQLLKRRWGTA